MNQIFYFWLSIAMIFFIIEIITPGIFFFSCLGIGALCAMIVSICGGSFVIQIIIFVIFSVVVIYFLKPILTKYFITKNVRSNIDSLISQEGIVVENIIGQKTVGMVKVRGELWRAISQEDVPINKDEVVVVTKIDGTHLVVRKK